MPIITRILFPFNFNSSRKCNFNSTDYRTTIYFAFSTTWMPSPEKQTFSFWPSFN